MIELSKRKRRERNAMDETEQAYHDLASAMAEVNEARDTDNPDPSEIVVLEFIWLVRRNIYLEMVA